MMKELLLKIARSAIEARLSGNNIDTKYYMDLYPELTSNGATFVTLTLNGELRGCIGSIIAHRSLIDDLIYNAQASAFNDPRFYALSNEEFSKIKIEVSILTEPKQVNYTDVASLRTIITPGEDGVILKLGNHQATFLPQVWDELPDFDLFFSHLGMKAGIGSDPLAFHPEIYTYHVEKIKEK